MPLPVKYRVSIDGFLYWSVLSTFFLIPVAKSPPLITGMLAIAVWLFSGKCVKDRGLWLKRQWLMPVALFALLPWIGLLWTNDPGHGLFFAQKSYFWLYALLIATLPQYPGRAYLYAFLSGLTLNSAVAVLNHLGLTPFIKASATGLLTGYNPHISYSLLLVFGILLLSFLYKDSVSNKRRLLFTALGLLFLANLSITIGRIGYVAIALLFPLVLYNMLGRRLVRMLLVQGLLVALFLASPTVQTRIGQTVLEVNLYKQEASRDNVGMRIYMWEKALLIIKEHPIIGVGTGGFENEIKKYDGHAFDHPHNSLLHMMVSYGIVGLISIVWLFAAFFKKGWRARDSLAGFSIIAFGLVLVIGSLTDTQVLSRLTAMLFALFMGVSLDKGGKNER